jgi:hypothetical protein
MFVKLRFHDTELNVCTIIELSRVDPDYHGPGLSQPLVVAGVPAAS